MRLRLEKGISEEGDEQDDGHGAGYLEGLAEHEVLA
jgi:hypothetical protein